MKNGFAVRLGGALLLAGLLCGSTLAGPVWICGLAGATACKDDGTTGQPDLGGLARPTFLRVDVDNKQVTILAPAERRGETSKIDSIQQVEKTWVLTGVERGRAWTLVITDDGHLTMSATGDGVVWAIFGNAIREEDLKPPVAPKDGMPAEKR